MDFSSPAALYDSIGPVIWWIVAPIWAAGLIALGQFLLAKMGEQDDMFLQLLFLLVALAYGAGWAIITVSLVMIACVFVPIIGLAFLMRYLSQRYWPTRE